MHKECHFIISWAFSHALLLYGHSKGFYNNVEPQIWTITNLYYGLLVSIVYNILAQGDSEGSLSTAQR